MRVDDYVSEALARYRGRRPVMDRIGVFCARELVVLIGLVAVGWAVRASLARGEGPALALVLLVALAGISWAVTLALEYLVRRRRPFLKLHERTLGRYWVPTPSFPSAHATIAFSIASTVAHGSLSVGLALLALAALVAVGRIYVGVHYLSDVVAGAIIGAGVTWGILLTLNIAIP